MYAPVTARETAGGSARSDSFPTAWLKLDLGNTRSSWAAAKLATLTAPEPTPGDQARHGTALPIGIEPVFVLRPAPSPSAKGHINPEEFCGLTRTKRGGSV